MPLNLHDAEEIRRVIVDPVVNGIKAVVDERIRQLETTLAAHVTADNARADGHEQRIQSLEKNQNRFFAYGALIFTVVAVVWSTVWDWVKKKMGL